MDGTRTGPGQRRGGGKVGWRTRAVGAAAALLLLGGSAPARAELPRETVGSVLTLPETMGRHWVWISDLVLRRSALFDADSGRMLGMVNGGEGVGSPRPLVARGRGEIYLPETIYSRGRRGVRTDLVTIYDAATLRVRGEVEIPPKRADNGNAVALAAVLDDERFLVVFNQTPATSVSVVDLERRRFVGEIPVAGCALVYPAGPRRFGMLCGDGTALLVQLDDSGHELRSTRSEPFFDPVEDPVTEKGARLGTHWLFASFEGQLHEVDFGGDAPVAAEPWPLFTGPERAEGWRIGGIQHLAVHARSGRLFSVVHRGGPGSHKDPGSEVWEYDIAKHERVARIEVSNLMAVFLRSLADIEAGSLADWLLQAVLPNPGVDSIVVTGDDAPLLLLANRQTAAVAVFDARSGKHVRDIEQTGLATGLLVVP